MNSRDNVTEPSYHFNYEGFTVAGPAYIPGLFSGSKENLFFFWSEECEQQLSQPRNQDPVKQQPNPTAIPGSNAYDTNFLRPYQGYGDIDFEGFDATTPIQFFTGEGRPPVCVGAVPRWRPGIQNGNPRLIAIAF